VWLSQVHCPEIDCIVTPAMVFRGDWSKIGEIVSELLTTSLEHLRELQRLGAAWWQNALSEFCS